jgi:flagellar basal-body rod protein FlgC
MGLFDSINAAGSALTAERLRMDVTAENLANAQSTRGADGQPYRRKEVILQSKGGSDFGQTLNAAMGGGRPNGSSADGGGVQVGGIVEDQTPFRLQYDPGHPDANAQGYVEMPNVNPVTEMVDLISASRGYEANVTAMQTAKQMFSKTLDILR